MLTMFAAAGALAAVAAQAHAAEMSLTRLDCGTTPEPIAVTERFSDTYFLGTRTGEALAAVYASADVLVFPSLTDTFGMVILEALACGLPVAAFPVMGPIDVIGTSGCGCLDADLRRAALRALDISRDKCRAYALTFTWQDSVRQFLDNITRSRSVFTGAAI